MRNLDIKYKKPKVEPIDIVTFNSSGGMDGKIIVTDDEAYLSLSNVSSSWNSSDLKEFGELLLKIAEQIK